MNSYLFDIVSRMCPESMHMRRSWRDCCKLLHSHMGCSNTHSHLKDIRFVEQFIQLEVLSNRVIHIGRHTYDVYNMIQNINDTNIYHPRIRSVFQRKPWLFSFHHRNQVLAGAMMVLECLLPKIKIRVNYVYEVVGSSIFICPQLQFFLTKTQINIYDI